MPSFKVEVPHQLGQESATARLQAFVQKVHDRYQSQVSNLQAAWEANTLNFGFTTYGFNIKGSMEVLAEVVRVAGDLPLMAALFKGRVEETIRDELAKVLNKPA